MNREQKIEIIKRLHGGEKLSSVIPPFDFGLLFACSDGSGYWAKRLGKWIFLSPKHFENAITETGISVVILEERDDEPEDEVLFERNPDE